MPLSEGGHDAFSDADFCPNNVLEDSTSRVGSEPSYHRIASASPCENMEENGLGAATTAGVLIQVREAHKKTCSNVRWRPRRTALIRNMDMSDDVRTTY